MTQPFILASTSDIRAQLLGQAAVDFTVVPARVDEEMVRDAMLAEAEPPRNIADALAELKARKISEKNPHALVLGCDQVLDYKGQLLSKPQTKDEAVDQLRALRNDRHMLLSAAVICEAGRPIWRHVGTVRLRMRAASDDYIEGYVARNWESIRHAVGAYKLEEEGVRLFTGIEGDYFNVLGLPLLELLSYLTLRGDLET
ncbi:Maf family protein [Roseobacter sp. YSTF-M11]|uniref:Nucleoside triphosphate pyrophosphatase n=1 Tax=Roseobacter insulae TaxID=2859783 RepID=A0A9X1FS57_9RHOB|nr:nucleoside triphosphate pyrophosphatase [Roseobacter insulae]MBW4706715.1 Maf family protein [Roseobacter insulae]